MELIITPKDELKSLITEIAKEYNHSLVNDLIQKISEVDKNLSIKEVAKYLVCDPKTVDNYVQKGLLIQHNFEGKKYFKMSELKDAERVHGRITRKQKLNQDVFPSLHKIN